MGNKFVKDYLLDFKKLYKNKSNPLDGLYKLQKTVGTEKSSRLNVVEKSNLLDILDSDSLAKYSNVPNEDINVIKTIFGGESNMFYFKDTLKSLYNNAIYDIKNDISSISHQVYKLIFGLNKHPSELNYNRKFHNLIHDYV